MKLITTRDIIKSVPERWARQYSLTCPDTGTAGRILSALRSLDLETCTTKDIANVIGNGTWTNLHCHSCEKNVEAVVHIPDVILDNCSYICKECAAAALAAFKINKHEDNNE